MKTITLAIEDSISDKFIWLLNRFSNSELRILEQSEHVSDDEYLRESMDWQSFAGTLRHSPNFNDDPLVIQQAMRNE
jgi:hypothetical protein